MRRDLRSFTTSARPGRAVLVAALFATVLATVGAFVLATTDRDAEDAVSTSSGLATGRAALVAGRAAEPSTTSTSTTTSTSSTTDDDGGVASGSAADAGPGLGDLAAHDATTSTSDRPEVRLVEVTTPETTEAPTTEPPTTEAPTTEAPTTEAPTTEPAPETSSPETAAADDPGTTDEAPTDGAPETTETVPETTTTEAPPPPAHPEGWVDAGHGVFVPPVLLQIRYCESRDNYTAANPASSARGAYQFLRSSWAAYGHADRYGVSEAHLASPAQQDEAALLTWERDGTRPWNASRHCWG